MKEKVDPGVKGTPSAIRKHKCGKCATPRCLGKIPKEGGWFCCTCRTRTWRWNNPDKYAFQTLRTNARRRGKEFTLTFDEFKEFDNKFNYTLLRGKTAFSLSVDRKDPELGYTKDNINGITLAANTAKMMYGRKYGIAAEKTAFAYNNTYPDPDVPF